MLLIQIFLEFNLNDSQFMVGFVTSLCLEQVEFASRRCGYFNNTPKTSASVLLPFRRIVI